MPDRGRSWAAATSWVARGAIGNPFIFREIQALLEGRPLPPPPTVAEQREALEEHLRLTADAYGPDRAGVVMRKVCIRYADLHPLEDQVRLAFIQARTSHDVEDALRRWYDPASEWPPVRRVVRGAAEALAE
jgi:tRNA-dihydrouridine synthase B